MQCRPRGPSVKPPSESLEVRGCEGSTPRRQGKEQCVTRRDRSEARTQTHTFAAVQSALSRRSGTAGSPHCPCPLAGSMVVHTLQRREMGVTLGEGGAAAAFGFFGQLGWRNQAFARVSLAGGVGGRQSRPRGCFSPAGSIPSMDEAGGPKAPGFFGISAKRRGGARGPEGGMGWPTAGPGRYGTALNGACGEEPSRGFSSRPDKIVVSPRFIPVPAGRLQVAALCEKLPCYGR